MMSWGRKKWFLRFKKMKDSAKPVSGNGIRKRNKNPVSISPMDDGFYWRISFDNEKYEEEVVLENSDYQKINVSPVSSGSFKKTTASNGRTMREFIGEHGLKSTADFSRTPPKKLNSDLQMIVEGSAIEDSNIKEDWQKLKINEIKLKSEKQKKSVEIRKKSKQGRKKVKAFSPRTVTRAECRIKAFEDMKRTRIKTKELNKEKPVKDAFRTGFNSFAIVKSSYDPQRDFRDSMIEMIIENGIRKRAELEELLACYLILNCDEYHHLIIKVFQQVWLELNHSDSYSKF